MWGRVFLWWHTVVSGRTSHRPLSGRSLFAPGQALGSRDWSVVDGPVEPGTRSRGDPPRCTGPACVRGGEGWVELQEVVGVGCTGHGRVSPGATKERGSRFGSSPLSPPPVTPGDLRGVSDLNRTCSPTPVPYSADDSTGTRVEFLGLWTVRRGKIPDRSLVRTGHRSGP